MDKDFDFDNIGKRTPYRTPDNFFEDSHRQILESTVRVLIKKRRQRRIIWGVIAVAAVLAGLLFTPSLLYMKTERSDATIWVADQKHIASDPMDKWINELSDEELEELVNFSESDIFLN